MNADDLQAARSSAYQRLSAAGDAAIVSAAYYLASAHPDMILDALDAIAALDAVPADPASEVLCGTRPGSPSRPSESAA